MDTKIKLRNRCRLLSVFVFFLFLSCYAVAQTERAVDGQKAICKVTVGDKIHTVTPNQIGFFNRVYNIKPLDTVAIEIAYPNGNTGEKVVVNVEDGGRLDNGKWVKVVQLNNQGKLSFNFQVTRNEGIYRITLRKGKDTKTVQLWVGTELSFTQLATVNIVSGQTPPCGMAHRVVGTKNLLPMRPVIHLIHIPVTNIVQ